MSPRDSAVLLPLHQREAPVSPCSPARARTVQTLPPASVRLAVRDQTTSGQQREPPGVPRPCSLLRGRLGCDFSTASGPQTPERIEGARWELSSGVLGV